jgi:hypothetical protein
MLLATSTFNGGMRVTRSLSATSIGPPGGDWGRLRHCTVKNQQLGNRKHRNHSANLIQSDTARRLRAEKVQLEVRFRDDKTEAEESLKKRMLEFLVDVPGWMMTGL